MYGVGGGRGRCKIFFLLGVCAKFFSGDLGGKVRNFFHVSGWGANFVSYEAVCKAKFFFEGVVGWWVRSFFC